MKRKGFLAGLTLLLLACAATAPALTGTSSPVVPLLAADVAPAKALLTSPLRLRALAPAVVAGNHPPVVLLAGLLPAHDGAVALIGMR